MRALLVSVIGIACVAWMGSAGISFAADEDTITPSATDGANTAAEPEVKWLWGEVMSVDASVNTLKVRYLDFETDSEKEAVVSVDDKTAFENIASLADVKEKDNVSVDYVMMADGKLVAKYVGLEKVDPNVDSSDGALTDDFKFDDVAKEPVVTQ